MARYLITGVAGFIGSHLAHALVECGEQVRGLDNFSTGHIENLVGLEGKLDLLEVDLCDAAGVVAACEGVDYILHQGALPSVPRSVKAPRPSHDNNIQGTFNLLEGARAAGTVRRVIYAASSSAYGNQPGFPRVETMTPQPIAPYAVQKLTGELYMQSYWRVYGLETVCLRYFNIFGPRQDPNSAYAGVVPRFFQSMLRNEAPTITGDGEQGRDFTFVDNAVQANLRAIGADAAHVAGRVFNIACGGRHTLNETYAAVAEITGFQGSPHYTEPRVGDVLNSQADISAAREAFGYAPHVGFIEGLRKTGAYYLRMHQKESRARL